MLALGTACTVLAALAVSTSMTGMTGMTQVDQVTAVAPALLSPAGSAVGEVSELAPSGLGDSCDTACIGTVTAVCSGAVALVVPLLVLLLATRRDTFIGLLRRAPARDVRGRWPQATPWTIPSLAALCVLRV